ncbi:PDZ domain-containing protein [Psychrosphaera sp. B3R10]|uniref:PDZ domain-containing protein n=1 Tax=unclassified Psychrosphaera TaxID=2641570 RepID=UPI001C09E7E9|nr:MULTISPECIES: PDZ domain-containing protein [unclassified Psychrosphaera]MBU2881490.1 PDZ domain-containing protein [Psychrosphaera sp. I2R16]MBU2989498.1 PDZ domain-containing protein [Psychrosphaera sp. B3R10]
MHIFILLISIFLFSCADHNDNLESNLTTASNNTELLIVYPKGQLKQNGFSLDDALSFAKELLALEKNVEIILTSGTYYLEKPIILGPEFSGTKERPFTIRAQENANVILSGAKLVRLNWEGNNQLMKAQLPVDNVDQLYINGRKQINARFPNFNSSVQVFNGYAADAISPERVATWKNPKGGFVHALHEGRWGGMHYLIKGVTNQGELTLEGGFQNNRQSPMHEKYRYVENIFEELDAPNEWYFDQTLSVLYFYPPADLDLSIAKVEISQLDNLIELRGSSKAPVKHINIHGLTFTQTNQTFMKTKEPLLRSDWAIYRGGAIFLDGTDNIHIANNEFYNLGGNAIFVSNYNRNANVSGNEIFDIGASAISFVGNPSAVRSPSFEYHEFVDIAKMDMKQGPKNENYPSKSIATDNLIYDIGLVEKQVAGVQLSMSSDITVSHNSIYRVPRSGINVSEGTWGGHIIEYNDVFDTVLETGDHGAFNSWGRDRFWHPDRAEMVKLAKEHPGMYKVDVLSPIIIRNNRFQCDHGWDIDLDDGSSNYKIYNNVALSGGLKLREGFNRTVENNIILNNSFHPHVWFENSDDTFRYNIVLASHKPILNNHWGNEVDKNFFTTEQALLKAQKLGLDSHSKFGNPQFVAPEKGNYQVSNNSLALTVGFTNFPMDEFGVISEELKAKAERPDFPNLYLNNNDASNSTELELFDATFKSVTTLGEQSALGIPEIAGALVLDIVPSGKANLGGLKKGDVILRVIDSEFGGEDKIITTKDLLTSYRSRKWRGTLEMVIMRNQQEQHLVINLLD